MWMLQSSWPPSITKTTPEKNEIKYILKKKLRLTKKKGSFFHLKITVWSPNEVVFLPI